MPFHAATPARTRTYLLLSGYLNYRFTGRFVDSIASQVGYVPFDYRRGGQCALDCGVEQVTYTFTEHLVEVFVP